MAQVWGSWGGGESLSTCEMAHWAAAMAVLATEAALMRLPSLEAISLGRMSETGSETGGPRLEEQQGRAHGRLGGIPSVFSHPREPLKRAEGEGTLVKRQTSCGGKHWKRRAG